MLKRLWTGRPDAAAVLIISLVFGINVYRAWTQSFTADEAYSYNLFISKRFSNVFADYNAGNHVLQSALSKVSANLFGLSEFTLRLPTLLGGLLYFVSAFRLSRFLFGGGWLAVLSVASLSLNPFILDYLSAARGYGLGLGFLLWAVYHLLLYFEDSNQLRLYKAGLGLGLSVSSVLIYLYPAVALLALVAAILVADGALSSRDEAKRRFWFAVDQFAGPAALTAFLILVIPLSRAAPEHFYYGTDNLDTFVKSLTRPSLFHTLNVYAIIRHVPGFMWWETAVYRVVIPAVLAALAALAILAARKWLCLRRFDSLDRNERALLLIAGAIALSLVMMIANHLLFGVPYLLSRTAIFFVPLFTLAVMLLIARPERPLAIPALAFAVWAVGMFAAGFNAGHYTEWKYDRNTKTVMRMLKQRNSAGREVRMGVHWQFEPSVNFYRRLYRLDWLKRVDRSGPDGDFDYYYLGYTDTGLVEKRRLRPLLTDAEAQVIFAVRSSETQPESQQHASTTP
ncbi:MAG: glycosyltransferase family 39 protein [Rhodospirillales bacterium]